VAVILLSFEDNFSKITNEIIDILAVEAEDVDECKGTAETFPVL